MKRLTPDTIRANYPITRVRLFGNGLEILRGSSGSEPRSRGQRGYIQELSTSSLCKLAFSAQNSRVQFKSMLCLSCGVIYPKSGIIFKRALGRVISAMRYRYAPLDYLWFLEFQRNGAPHAHVLTTVERPTQNDREWMAMRWAGSLLDHAVLLKNYDEDELRRERAKMVRQHRRVKNWEALRAQDGAARYVTKYATKTEQKSVPRDFANVGRFWSMSADARPKHLLTNDTTEEMLRIHLRNKNHPVAEWDVLPRLVWFSESAQAHEE